MKTIIVALDYSRAACNALAYAAALASQWQAKLVLFNAYQLPAPVANTLMLKERKSSFLAENKARLESIARQTSSLYSIPVGWSTNFSYLTDELDVQVALLEADLVVMGMKRTAADHKIFGSNTISIIRHAKYPVLVVPEAVQFRGMDKILFACDYKHLAADNKLTLLHDLAISFQSRVQVLHVEKEEELVTVGAGYRDDVPDLYENMLASLNLDPLFSKVKHEYKYLEDDNIIRGIDRGVDEFDADLLVMVPHRTSFWDTLMERSNTCKMAHTTHVPLLALPNKHHK